MKPILYIPEKLDTEREAVAAQWQSHGGIVRKLGRFWEKPTIEEGAAVAIYGNDTFALVLAQVIGVTLVSPDDEIIAELDLSWVKREINIHALAQLSALSFPCFVKSVTPKLIPSKVYNDYESLLAATNALTPDTLFLTAAPVAISCEVRAFILKNKIQSLSIYEGHADIAEAELFINDFLAKTSIILPTTYVLDVAYIPGKGWCVLEFNASWGAGLNGCKPEKVIDCIKAATVYSNE